MKAVTEESVSQRNGDRARFGRERKRRTLERKRIRELRVALENKAARPTLPAPELVNIASLAVEPTG